VKAKKMFDPSNGYPKCAANNYPTTGSMAREGQMGISYRLSLLLLIIGLLAVVLPALRSA